MEVMSMKDMKKIPGGTDAQRKIAQDRQRKREAKNRGFTPEKKSALTSSALTIRPKSTLAADKGSTMVKRKRGDLAKPSGKLSKRPESKPVVQDVQKVKVKVDEPKRRDDMEGQAGQRPASTNRSEILKKKEAQKGKKDRRSGILGRAGRLAAAAARRGIRQTSGYTGVFGDDEQQGSEVRDYRDSKYQ